MFHQDTLVSIQFMCFQYKIDFNGTKLFYLVKIKDKNQYLDNLARCVSTQRQVDRQRNYNSRFIVIEFTKLFNCFTHNRYVVICTNNYII